MPKPDISQLLVDSALRPELRRRLAETPDKVFDDYDLTPEERDLLRRPDHRLLPYLGAALGRATGIRPVGSGLPESSGAGFLACAEARDPNVSRLLPDALMAFTVVPCLVGDTIAYAAWVAPLQEGGDPSRLSIPAGASLPGQALTPLHAVIQLSAAYSKDANGRLQVSMWASFRQSSNVVAAPPPEAEGNPEASPFDSPEVQAAAAAVRSAAPADRYEKLVALTRALRGGDVR